VLQWEYTKKRTKGLRSSAAGIGHNGLASGEGGQGRESAGCATGRSREGDQVKTLDG